MHRLARWYGWLHGFLATVAAVLIAFIALGIATDVVMRNSGLGVLSWMLEAAEYALFVATLLGAPWVLRLGAHVRVDVLVAGLPRPLGRALDVAADLVGLAVALTIAYYATAVAWQSAADGSRVIKEFIFPEWWIYAVVAVSGALLAIEFGVRLAGRRPTGG